MLRLLLCLASVHLLSVDALVSLDGPKDLDIQDCPITFYGVTYQTLHVRYSADNTQNYCFGKEGDRAQGTAGDCLIVPTATTTPTYEITRDFSALSHAMANIRSLISGLEDSEPDCALVMRMRHEADTLVLVVNFGGKSLYYVSTTVAQMAPFIITVNGKDEDISNISPGQPKAYAYSLIGCRVGDEVLGRKRTSATMLDGCIRKYCTEEGTLEDQEACEGEELCMELRCVLVKACAAVGNSVIDTLGQTAAIGAFCEYRLLKGLFFDMTASFSERRLGDVPLLDTVTITTNKGVVKVHPGGTVTDESEVPVTPTEEATEIHGLSITKVQGGVSIVFIVPFFKILLETFFDGTTLHVTETAPMTYVKSGLCSDVTTETPALTALTSCDAPESDPGGDGLDCDAVKERCEKVLLESPFDRCSVDRVPYVEACSNLLCNYPDTDGLFCHLLDTYARSCQLQDWREAAGCSVSQCYFRKCLYENEFCGLSVSGEPGCFCRSSYAAPYRAKDSLGGDVVCADKSASVSLLGCLLEENGFDPSSLHLNSAQCTGVRDAETNAVSFSFSDTDDCGATVEVDGDRIVYTNVIASGGGEGPITREKTLSVGFSCAYAQPQVQSLSLRVKDNSVVKVMDSGDWTYVFKLEAFKDVALTEAADSDLLLDQLLWVRAEATEVDGTRLSLVIEACWATGEDDAEAEEKYELIRDGCSVEESTTVVSSGAALSSVFSFRVFEFVNSDGDVFVHCDAKLCLTTDGCTKTC